MKFYKSHLEKIRFSSYDPFDLEPSLELQMDIQIESWIESKREAHIEENTSEKCDFFFYD
jgi:hypothetical protein